MIRLNFVQITEFLLVVIATYEVNLRKIFSPEAITGWVGVGGGEGLILCIHIHNIKSLHKFGLHCLCGFSTMAT